MAKMKRTAKRTSLSIDILLIKLQDLISVLQTHLIVFKQCEYFFVFCN